MSEKLDVRATYCRTCGSDDLQLYSLTPDGRPCHAICNNCERDEIIDTLTKQNEILKKAVEFYGEYYNWCIYDENDTGRILMVGDDYDDSKNIPPNCAYIGGKTARQALKDIKEYEE